MKTYLKRFTELAINLTRNLTNNLFKDARYKLTVYYVVVILIIMAIFTGVLLYTINFSMEDRLGGEDRRIITIESVKRAIETEGKVIGALVYYIDFTLILVVTFLSYFLAGKTLKPIEKNFDNQKRFFADMSHDLRTPISIITTESEVALQSKTNDENHFRKVVESNLEEARKMSKLISSLLSIFRDENKYITNEFISINLFNFVKNIVQKMKLQAKNKNLSLILSRYKKIIIKVDAHNFERVVLNVLQNAINYTDIGNVKILITDDDKNAYLVISDTGKGIDEQDLPFVFDRFYKAKHSKKDESSFGLGLYISKQIIEQHGGNIEIVSRVNVGTRIAITIPKS